MLQLKNISKSYTTGSFTQNALDDVSIAFRDNEFVAILGPSGSGKTTMLNILGGLDHYDEGDLVIEGISTKEFKDRDWDAYRNNRVGFVFQSYNLIPHQTVLANVELALTLSGVSREERRSRAKRALERVGLGDHIDKKPAQMSGGQMQRVAIARALINDPEILLADEPTGALDSKTSVQIMDLLTEIASDRLVVMVTHNPELAQQYATRIVNLADGHIIDDSDPFLPTAEQIAGASAKPTSFTHMSFLTALSLSANNLLTKKGRTIMTAIAGSIGIIGIAAILALANGVNNYIKTVEEDTLSVYPLQIMSTGFNMTAMFMGSSGDDAADGSDNSDDSSMFSVTKVNTSEDNKVHESRTMTRMFASIGKNDLASLKTYFDSGESGIDQYTNNLFYEYAVTPQIFDKNTAAGVRQVNPDKSFSSLGFDSTSSMNSLLSSSMSTDIFSEMPQNDPIIEAQFDMVRGHWPEKENELVLVLSRSGKISDFTSYVLGLRDSAELKEMVRQFSNEENVTTPETEINATYDDILGLSFKLVSGADMYEYNTENNVWVDKTNDEEYMKRIIDAGEDLVISGIVCPKEDANAVALQQGIYYTPALVEHMVEKASQSAIVKEQLADPKRDVFSGRSFDELEKESDKGLDMSSLFAVDEEAFSNVLSFDSSALNMSSFDFSNMDGDAPQMDLSGLQSAMTVSQVTPDDINTMFGDIDMAKVMAGISVKFTDNNKAMDALIQGYIQWAATHPGKTSNDFFNSPEGQQLVSAVGAAVDTADLEQQLTASLAQQMGTTPDGVSQAIGQRVASYYGAQMSARMADALGTIMTDYMTAYMETLSRSMTGMMTQLSSNIQSAMRFNPDALTSAFQFNMSQEELTELMTSMMRADEHSYDSNLKKLGYADFAKPSEISIYPKDFESKEHIITILNNYNDQMRETDKDKVISYTDIVGTLMSSVTTIINMISTVLIAFVAISLIVSSIMIGVITYISVLERRKEIGILRAIGASKSDVSHVFNAETVIEGLIAGLLGVGVTALGCIPANIIVDSIFNVPNVALLPINAAAILVGISVVLTFIAGLIPSGSASRKDPVEALRSE